MSDETKNQAQKTPEETKTVEPSNQNLEHVVELSDKDLKHVSGGLRMGVDGEAKDKDHKVLRY